MKIIYSLILALPSFLSQAQPGRLLASFGNNGKVITNMGTSGNVLLHAMVIQPDGKILLAGNVVIDGSEDFAVVRYNPDGSVDNTFDGDGKVYTAVGPGSDIPHDIALQNDGKIVVVGRSSSTTNGTDVSVVRYNANGSLDSTFGFDGKVMTNLSTSTGARISMGRAVHIMNNGKILVGGYTTMSGTIWDFAVLRYNSDGSLDSSFDEDGKLTTNIIASSTDMAFTMVVQPDGKFILGGRSINQGSMSFALVRYNVDGTLDNSWNGNGIVTTVFNGLEEQVNNLAIQNDGKIVAVGYAIFGNTTSHDFAIARYNANGSLDGTFGTGGKIVNDYLGFSDIAYSVALQSDGKLLVGGTISTGGNFDFALFRYKADGSFDNTFGENGKVTTPIGPGHDVSTTMAVNGNTIYLGGYSSTGTNNDFALVAYQNDATVLPLSSIVLTGKKVADGARLEWKTLLEDNVAYFDVELSIDGRMFTKVAQLPARLGGAAETVYYYFDKRAREAVCYYRIKSVDKDGKFTYSKIVLLKLDTSEGTLVVYPNPVKDFIKVRTSLSGNLYISIADVTGRVLKQLTVSNSTNILLNTNNLSSGIYRLTINGADTTESITFIKE